MPRTKIIDEDTCIKHIDEYIQTKCNGNPYKIKFEDLARYISNKEGKTLRGYVLRRNDLIRSHISDMKKIYKEKPENLLSTIEIKSLPEISKSCPDYKSLLQELIVLHNTCTELLNTSKTSLYDIGQLEKTNLKIKDELQIKNDELTKRNGEYSTLKKENISLRKVISHLKKYIKTYVDPEIASAILNEPGIPLESKTINKEALFKNIISADTEIKFKTSDDPDVDGIIKLFGD